MGDMSKFNVTDFGVKKARNWRVKGTSPSKEKALTYSIRRDVQANILRQVAIY